MDEQPQTQALAVRPMGLGYLRDLARTLAASGYFRDALKMEQAAAKIKAGEELGIPPMAAMQAIYFFDGKTSLSATLIATLIQKSGRFSYRVRLKTAEECRIEFFEGAESLGIESFTIREAQTAGLASKDNWRKYPKAMLFNRAMSNGAKTYCPAVFAGQMVYTPDELDPDVTVNPDTGEIVDGVAMEVPDAAPATTQQRIEIQRLFTTLHIKHPSQWLGEQGFPPATQTTTADAERILATLHALDTPSTESVAPPAPELELVV